ncbi:SGNH/GDSL hydrolase family protein [Kriegella aquimaris]|uniref:Lysophospholipase L1 n=1 Tax=Kriegella aquimaris TaxID=192904 RepID=A0A1G9XWK0_9FLAO|nr:SGNH/GDSL hydrolase family protein [Kriegella aquimaris]SDN00535.1 Lysophospholipase L1 [Kriegella aquimaris]
MKVQNQQPLNISSLTILSLVFLMLVQCTTSEKEFFFDGYTVRGGLNNVLFKMKNRDTVRIAYLGGSITAQPGWRIHSFNWFKENYPETEFVEINAAIGGTGSPFGAYRLKDQVLQYNPDLVFVEFAVNDSNTNPEEITRSMEGITHQIWKQNPEIDICFIYTIKEDFLDIYKKYSLPSSIATMEKIAEHYQIPSINFGPEVLRRVDEGKVLFKGNKETNDSIVVFSPDGVHPYPESGHKIYHEVFVRALTEMKSKSAGTVLKHNIVKPLNANPSVNTKMIDWGIIDSKEELTAIETKSDSIFKRFSRYFNSIGKGVPGDSLSFQFRGKAFGFYDVIGPGTGTLEVSVDGEKQNHNRFDGYCTYWRISYKTIGGWTDSIHTVSIKVRDEPIDKNKILSANNRSMGQSEDYTEINWYLAKILLDGELIENKNYN